MKKITVNGITLYRHFHPLFPNAFIMTAADHFVSYYPPSRMLIIGEEGSYIYRGKKYTADAVYYEGIRVCGKPVRKIVYFDGKLSMKPLYVDEDYFITLVANEPVLVKNDEEVYDIEEICHLLKPV